MRLQDIIARLEAKVTDIKSVGGALAFTTLKDGAVKRSPAAFVLPGNERASENRLSTGGIRQKVSVRFKVLLAFQRPGASGGKSIDDFEAIRKSLHGALIGWRSDGMQKPVTYVGTQVLGIEKKTGTAWFELTYATSTQISTRGQS